MKKRFVAGLMAVVILVGAVPPVAMAVTPADPLIASALYSFLLSAGYKLFRQGGIEDADLAAETLTSDIITLYGEFSQEAGTGYDWQSMGQGVSVSEGNFILSHSSALSAQAFADWLAAKNSGANSQTELIQGTSGGEGRPGEYTLSEQQLARLPCYQAGYWEMPVYTSQTPLETTRNENGYSYHYSIANNTNTVYLFIAQAPSGNRSLCFCSIGQFQVIIKRYKDGEPDSTPATTNNSSSRSVNNVIDPNDGTKFTFQYYEYPDNATFQQPIEINYYQYGGSIGEPRREMSYCILAGEKSAQVDLGALIGSLGPTIANLVHDLAQDQGLAVSVGAAQDADEETVVGIAVGDFALPDAETEIGAVATPVPVEGVTEPYPQPAVTDVDSLGLPDLGAALTSRFPFCIPWDFVNVYKSLNASAQCPVIDVDLFPASFKAKVGVQGDTSFTINFGDPKYSTFITLIHWGSLVGFVLALAFATKRLIWTTGG